MLKKLYLCVLLLGFIVMSTSLNAQSGRLTVRQSDKITSLVEKHVTINKEKKRMKGYRLQIYSVSGVGSREKAQEVLDKFLKEFPDAQAYIVYKAPYYSVRIGDFRTQIEALYFLQTILTSYPYAFPVIDYIEYPSFG